MSSPTTKRQATKKKNVQSESAQHSQTTTTKSQSKSYEGDTEKSGVGRKNVKRKLDTSSTGPCLNVQLRDPHDTLADFQDEEEEEEEEEAVEEDNSDHVEPDVEEENDNGLRNYGAIAVFKVYVVSVASGCAAKYIDLNRSLDSGGGSNGGGGAGCGGGDRDGGGDGNDEDGGGDGDEDGEDEMKILVRVLLRSKEGRACN
ncbi:aspartate, glycine, lysine and serine-rich protein-like [Papaver somniferum]|uniref:aspartate, glycine, lysine and serine-rich protein-like n=1 Tax=Papaver somniferum TaxID=3469 RepID=UPI000E6FB6C9|nr:aspartate, glycine, lysine and serine-rich protein-like [Papaver somniferum]